MGLETIIGRVLAVLVILTSQVMSTESQNLEKTTKIPLPASDTTPAPGINLGESFFLQKLREGNVGALNDFNSLRHTLIIPANQQKSFTNSLQQQNPFQRFALWNMMQNSPIHGFPNSHAVAGMPFRNPQQFWANQQTIPLQQYLTLLMRNRGQIQENIMSGQEAGADSLGTASSSQVGIPASETKDILPNMPITTRSPAQAVPTSQDVQTILPRVANTHLGLLKMDRIKEVLRSKVHQNSLNNTMTLISNILRNRSVVSSRQNAPTSNTNRGGMKFQDTPKDFSLQFVGDLLPSDSTGEAGVSQSQPGLIDREITGRFWTVRQPTNQNQRAIQFVGNILGNSMFRNTNSAANERLNGIGNTKSLTLSSPQTTREDVFIRFVGDMTGAKLVRPNTHLSKQSNREVNKNDAIAFGMKNQRNPSLVAGNTHINKDSGPNAQTDINAKFRGGTPFASRDFVLQRVGNLLADQLTPIDGALIAFNETSTGIFTKADVQNKTENTNTFLRPNMVLWPTINNMQPSTRPFNNFNQNRHFLQNIARTLGTVRLQSRQDQRPEIKQQFLPAMSRNVVDLTKTKAFGAFDSNDRNSKVIRIFDEKSEIDSSIKTSNDDIATIVRLLKSVTSETKETDKAKRTHTSQNDRNKLQNGGSFTSNTPVSMPQQNLNSISSQMDLQQNKVDGADKPLVNALINSANQRFTSPQNDKQDQISFQRMDERMQISQPSQNDKNMNVKSSARDNLENTVRRQLPFRNNEFNAKHQDFVPDRKTKFPNPQRINFQLNNSNKVQSATTKNKASSSTGIETGFILVNRLFVPDSNKGTNNKMDGKTNMLSISKRTSMNNVIQRKMTDPRTGKTFLVSVGVIPPSKFVETEQSTTSEPVQQTCKE